MVGSPLWQTIFLSFAVVLILFEIIRGWRLGILRQLMRLAAIVAAYAAAFFGGGALVPFLRPFVKIPDILISVLGGAILGMLVYALVASLGSILFKRTAQQSSGAVRLIYGLSGAFIGLLFGGFFIWLFLVGIRSVGSLAEAQVQMRPQVESARSRRAAPSSGSDRAPSLPNFDPDSLTTLLARLKNSVELGAVGDAIKRTDVVPADVYQTLTDAGTVLATPEGAQRFLAFPGAVELGEHPKIVALRNDPEIAEMISQGRIFDLLRDPRILDAANDPTLAERVKQFDLQKALEHAAKKN